MTFTPSSRLRYSARGLDPDRAGRGPGLCSSDDFVFWGSMAFTLIGGTAVGTILIVVFLPALYALWFRIKPAAANERLKEKQDSKPQRLPVVATAAE